MKGNPRLLRITTVPISLKLLLRGQLSFFKQQGFDVMAVSADGPEVASIREEGATHKPILLTRRITPLHDLVAVVQLVLLIMKFRPHIIHSHTPKAGLIGMIAGKLCGVPIRLHTVAGLPIMEAHGIKRWILKITENLTYLCAHQVYPNSKGLKDIILTNFAVNPAKVKVLGSGSSNGIDTGYFERSNELERAAKALRVSHGVADNDIVFCFVGRVVRDKGINELVQAFARLQQEMSAIYLFLVGPFEDDLDPISDVTRDVIKKSPNILSVGYQSDVRPYLVASDIFVFPSYREGFPNVVLQACALELPCIVSDINGCNEIIEDNRTGLIVKPKDTDGLLNAMRSLALDPFCRKTLCAEAAKFVRSQFSHQKMLQLLKDEYLKLLNERGILKLK